MTSNGMSFGKTIALNFYLWHRNASIQWIRRLWNMLVLDWMRRTNKQNKGKGEEGEGSSLRRKTETKIEQNEWRNVGREIQLGGGYSVPWDVGWSRPSLHGGAMGRMGDWGRAHMMLVKRQYVDFGEAPCY